MKNNILISNLPTKNPFRSITKRLVLVLILLFAISSVFSQQTVTSTGGGGNWSNNGTWDTGAPPTDDDEVIIRDGDVVIINTDVDLSNGGSIQVGQGTSGQLSFGNGTDGVDRYFIVGNVTVLSGAIIDVSDDASDRTHSLTISGDLVNNNGSIDLTNGGDVVNTSFNNTTTSVLSGSAMTFNDMDLGSLSGGIILIAPITVEGLTNIDNIDVNTTTNHFFQGDFTLASDATFTATSSTQTFNGTTQTITLSTGTTFNGLTFDGGSKTVIGNLVADGTFEITATAGWEDDDPLAGFGYDHQLAILEVKNDNITIQNSTITFTGGELRFDDGVGVDGSFTLGVEVDITFAGNCSIERDDQVTVDGDVTITSPAFLILNGTSGPTPPAGESDALLNVTGTRTLTIEDGGDLFMRGYDNFPTGFTTYTLDPNSLVRYDADFDQIIRSEDSGNNTISIGRLFLSQADDSPQRTRTLFTGDANLEVNGQVNLVNGVSFLVGHAATLTFGEDIQVDNGTTAGDPIFSASSSVVILDANSNQTMDGPLNGTYNVGELRITNSNANPIDKLVNIDNNVTIQDVFEVTNPNGSDANQLTVDLDDNIITGQNLDPETFTLGSNCTIFSSSEATDGFAQNFDDGSDVVNIDATSTVRFDRDGNQSIPNFNGGQFGNIEFAGSGNKYVGGALDINGDVSRIGGNPVFRFGTFFFDPPGFEFPSTVSHTIAGDWNMGTQYTGDDESDGGSEVVTITFDGADQIISASDFDDVIFAGSGTKTLTGNLLIDGDFSMSGTASVNAGSEAIDIAGNWDESGSTGTFTQTGSTTDFIGTSTQTITQNTGSQFHDLDINSSGGVIINSTIQVGRDFDLESGNAITIEDQNLRVSRDLNLDGTLLFTDATTTTITLDGSSEQDIRPGFDGRTFPSISFEGVGNKELFTNDVIVEGDFTIAAESAFNGNGQDITFRGSQWSNAGTFTHNADVIFETNATVSTSSFHDVVIGEDAASPSVTPTVTLSGNITVTGELNIFKDATLDVSASNFNITIKEDFNNYGTFVAQQGTVTFVGDFSQLRTLGTNNSGAQADKAFYNLTINVDSDTRLDIERGGVILNEQVDVLNDLNIISGELRLDLNTGPQQLNIGGDFVITNGSILFINAASSITMNGTSGSHNINVGGSEIQTFEINAPGATYSLSGDFSTEDNTTSVFTMTAGTLDLNGNIMSINRGGLDQTGGTIIINEGASLLLNDLSVDPDYNKTGGDLQIVGIDGNPATLSSVDAGGFTFTQSTSGDIAVQFAVIANIDGDGIRIEGGTINTAGTPGNDFSNTAFTSGLGSANAYLTLDPSVLNNISASNVVFNEGPTHNVSLTDLGTAHTVEPTIEFVIAGGTLAGPQDEEDNPDGSGTSGFIRWDEDPGLTWTGAGDGNSWDDGNNWNDPLGLDADDIPDLDDIVYIENGITSGPTIADGETFSCARMTLRLGGTLTLDGDGLGGDDGTLTVDGNLTNFNGSSITMNGTSQLNVAGAWSNAGTFTEGTATVTFNGSEGTHSITTLGNTDPFANLVINGVGATYTMGSIIRVNDSFTLSGGTFDASSGFDMNIEEDWSVSGGIFEPGQGTVNFLGTTATTPSGQDISGGTLFNIDFEGDAAKNLTGNIQAGSDVNFRSGTGTVSADDNTIFVGDDWNLTEAGAFDPGTGTVIFNGNGGQVLTANNPTFNNLIIQSSGTVDVGSGAEEIDVQVNGNLSIISESAILDINEQGGTQSNITITGSFIQTGGVVRVFGTNNFPTAATYSITGGEVEFRNDVSSAIPSLTYNDIEIRDDGGGANAATLQGDVTVLDDIVLGNGVVTFDAAGHTLTVNDVFSLANDDILTWSNGTLVFDSDNFLNLDPDFNQTTRAFGNLTFSGSNTKRINSDILVAGNLTVQPNVILQALAGDEIIGDGVADGDAFSLAANATFDNREPGNSLPSLFDSYDLDGTSDVELRGTGAFILNTANLVAGYGNLDLFNTGTVTLDGNLLVNGNFDMNDSPMLVDNGNNLEFGGSNIDLRAYTPSVSTIEVTFSRSGDQFIEDDAGAGQDLELPTVFFNGSGIKSLQPNAGDEVTRFTGNVTIASGVTVSTDRGIDYVVDNNPTFDNSAGGSFTLTINGRPLVFSGTGNITFNAGTNEIAAMNVGTGADAPVVTVTGSTGLNLGTADFIINTGSTIDFTGLTHNLASENVTNNGTWTTTNSTLIFDQAGGQNLPILNDATVDLQLEGTGGKLLTGNIEIDNITIGAEVNLNVDNANNYDITVNGNWTNLGGDFFAQEGTVIFNSTAAVAKTIDSNGEDFARADFTGSAIGTYTLLSNMEVDGNDVGEGLTLTSATLDLNGFSLILGDNDGGDPDAEANVIGLNGTLEVSPGGVLQFDTSDDGGDVADTEIGGNLDVQSGGTLNVVGNMTDVATVTRSAGGNRVDINVETGGAIGAQFYSFNFLTDEGLELEDGADLDGTNNFSNGSFSNIETDAGDGTGGDDNAVAGNTYLLIGDITVDGSTFDSDIDGALTITNVTFNFGGTPVDGEHFNVNKPIGATSQQIDFTSTSGPLGRNGGAFENDAAGGSPDPTTGNLRWEEPSDSRWTGNVSRVWNVPGNWDNGVPDPNDIFGFGSNDVSAVIPQGNVFNPTIDGAINVNISELFIEDGILKVEGSSILNVDGDVTLGDGTGGALIFDGTNTVTVSGSWTTSANFVFDNGNGTITFDAPAAATVSITPGDQSFHNVTFDNGGEYNLIGADINVENNLTISNSSTLVPSNGGYDLTVSGNVSAISSTFSTTTDGEMILNGTGQTIQDISVDELTISGTNVSASNLVIDDNFILQSTGSMTGTGSITFNGDVTIQSGGVFTGVASQTYIMTGDDWIAGPGSYAGAAGTVQLNQTGGTQYIREVDADPATSNPAEFHNLTLSGTANIELGRQIGANTFDGNVNMSGDLVINNTINQFDLNTYLIDNTGGGTMTLAANEIVLVEGVNNFPSNFGIYDLNDLSAVRYWGIVDQIINGVEYGTLDLNNSTIKTLGGNIDVDGDLLFRNATLDVDAANNYSINLAGRWDTNNGNDDGSFLAQDGTVTFDGGAAQTLDIAETGTQTFNDVVVNKSGGNVEVATSDMVITGNINVFAGTFDANGFTVSIGGNMNASGTGAYTSAGDGLYLLNATSGAPSIGANGSSIPGDFEINASGRIYELVSDLTVLNNFTLTAGTLDVNSQTLSVGDAEDVLNIFGTLNVSTAVSPGGTLALGNDVQAVVQPGGNFSLVGTDAQTATLTSTGTTDYIFIVTGTGGNPGRISARDYIIEYVGQDGIFINSNALINETNNFSEGIFRNGVPNGRYLRIENTQTLTNNITDVVFDDNPGGGAVNVAKITASSGVIVFEDYTGEFSGEDFDDDPNNLITWLEPPVTTWTGLSSDDWFNANNWDNGVPTSTQDAIIPQVLNSPVIRDNSTVAEAQSITLEVNATLEIITTIADDDDDIDLDVVNDISLENSASFILSGVEDDLEIGGGIIKAGSAIINTGTSDITFNSASGTESLGSNNFFNLNINVAGTALLTTDVTVNNDLTISSGTLDVGSNDLTIVGNLSSSGGTINPQSQTISFVPDDASARTIDANGSELNNVVIGEASGSGAIYSLENSLVVNGNFSLLDGTLDLTGSGPTAYNLTLGNDDGTIGGDIVTVSATLDVGAGETLFLGDDVDLTVTSTGSFSLTGGAGIATMTRRTAGSYDFTVIDGDFGASNFVIEHVGGDGIDIQSGSDNLTVLSNGTFDAGGGSGYLTLANDFSSDFTSTEVTLNNGPSSYNVSRTSGTNNLIFEDATGAFSGPTFEDDSPDGDAATGFIRWTFTNALAIWEGDEPGDETNWFNAGNWSTGAIPIGGDPGGNTVQIPNVANQPVIDIAGAASTSITIFSGATLTVNDPGTLTITNELTNEGDIVISGNGSIDVGDSWTNNGTFTPGTSTVTFTSAENVTISGGVRFYNLEIDANGAVSDGDGIVFSSSAALDVDNNFTITDGEYRVTNAAHTVNIGGNLVVDNTNGTYTDNLSTTTFDGSTAQNLGDGTSTLTFNNLTLAGSNTKTVLDQLDVNGNLAVNVGSTLDLDNQSMSFAGASFDVDGTFTSGGASTLTFDGSIIQNILGNVSSITFDNVVINNTAIGNNDIQLNIDVNISSNVDFRTGVVQSSGSNPLIFLDNATVSYDGTPDNLDLTNPIYITGEPTDGNSYAVGPIRKVGDDAFIFPTGEGGRMARIAISGLGGTVLNTDVYSADYSSSTSPDQSDPDLNGAIVRVSSIEFWDLRNVNGHGAEPQVSLFWDASSEVTNPSELTVAHYNSVASAWDDQGNGAVQGDATGGVITSSVALTSFSPVTLAATTQANPLPVELISFSGIAEENMVELSWATASETNNDRFEVFHSIDGSNFEWVGTVAGHGTTNERIDYRFSHAQAASGLNYYFLRQVDYDGSSDNSGVIQVENNFLNVSFEAVIYPNPGTIENLRISIKSVDAHTPINVSITDLSGKVYYSEVFNGGIGTDEKLDLDESITPGLYFLEISQGLNIKREKLVIN